MEPMVRIPHGVYYNAAQDNFYSAKGSRGMGVAFYKKWKAFSHLFPKSYREVTIMSRKVRMSSLDVHAPPDIEIMFRVQIPNGRRPPVIVGDYFHVEDAQRVLDKTPHSQYMTWWRRKSDGKHVMKWPTMNAGKRRWFKVSVPYTPGVSDAASKALLQKACPGASVTIDSQRNRAEQTGPVEWAVVDKTGRVVWHEPIRQDAEAWAADSPEPFTVRPLIFGD